MSDDLKIKDSNENDDMVNEVVDDFTMVQSENGDKVIKTEEVTEKIVDENSNKKPSFIASCAATISDAIIIGVLAYVLLYVVDFILKNALGLYIVEKNQMLFILYIVVSLLYVSVLESILGFTVGKTVFGIKVVRN